MALTTDDLLKIDELMKKLLGDRLERIEKELSTAKDERAGIKDMLIGIRAELDIEHETRYKKLEETSEQTEKNKKDIYSEESFGENYDAVSLKYIWDLMNQLY